MPDRGGEAQHFIPLLMPTPQASLGLAMSVELLTRYRVFQPQRFLVEIACMGMKL